mmetsp:Transcript_15614/g.38683  ORF Transcript_15614/g.38683 Transcript_15614/m.38683 type:complete len:102 (-) Transcript_15614:375-680(-)|eukprot:CAMPEP_0179009618 /NCGR_PEP_ID=MMETSP0795-20121207/16369_1 /TAXON_ID=88552 /ORGANISM="Amoebophrya sp., Strain Ameob2" /LENGTH=101 /DNA_ID=CAMNT_0020704829 /DNA_START=200 /DNA_END=505 /DNA_ORIENTATION=-
MAGGAGNGATIFRRPTDTQPPHSRPIFPHDRNQDVTNPMRWGSAFLNRTAAAWDSAHYHGGDRGLERDTQRIEYVGNHRSSRGPSHQYGGGIPLPAKFQRT